MVEGLAIGLQAQLGGWEEKAYPVALDVLCCYEFKVFGACADERVWVPLGLLRRLGVLLLSHSSGALGSKPALQ